MCLGEIRTQDAPYLVRKLLLNRVVGPQVWDFVTANLERLLGLYPENSIPRMLEVSRLCQLDADGDRRLFHEVIAFSPAIVSAASSGPWTRASSAWA